MLRAFFKPFTALALLSVVTGLSAQNTAANPNPRSLVQAANGADATDSPSRTGDFPWNNTAVNAALFQAADPAAINRNRAPRLPLAGCTVTALPNSNATSGNARAPSTRYTNARSVYLITAAELAANTLPSGSINGIGWNYQTAPVTAGSASLIVYLENTADTTNNKSTTWATAISTMTPVHNAATLLPGTIGTFDIPFTGGSPFTYTGGGLYVAFDWGTYGGTLSGTAVIFCNNTLANGLKGAQSTTGVPPTTLGLSAFRPETRFIPAAGPANDASSDFVMTFGEVPMGLIDPTVILSNITNRGSNPITVGNATLTVTGANSFTNSQPMPSLAACGGTDYVGYAPFGPTVLGINSVTATVPADDVNTNNTSPAFRLDTTINRYSYKEPGSSSVPGGVGVAGSTAMLVAKFTTNVATQVDSVTLDFPTLNATTYRLVILGNNGNGLPLLPPLYRDAADRTIGVAGQRTLRLPSPVSVLAGDFFVGVDQTNTTNMGLGFANETPIRAGSFFGVIPNTATAWFDFAPGTNFKLNLGAILGRCLVPLTVDVTPNGPINACSGSSVLFTATPVGGTGTLTYQWTENGIDIVGATSNTYTATKAVPGSFTYNVKVTDDGGCVDTTDASSSTANWGAFPPQAVNPLTAAKSAGNINLSWPAAAGATFYNVKRCTFTTAPCTPTVIVASPAGTTYSEADDANSYMYNVESVNACGITPLTR